MAHKTGSIGVGERGRLGGEGRTGGGTNYNGVGPTTTTGRRSWRTCSFPRSTLSFSSYWPPHLMGYFKTGGTRQNGAAGRSKTEPCVLISRPPRAHRGGGLFTAPCVGGFFPFLKPETGCSVGNDAILRLRLILLPLPSNVLSEP